MRILYARPQHVGWSSVTRMVRLLGHCFESEVTLAPGEASWSRRRQFVRRLPRRRGRAGDLLVVAPVPADLNVVLRAEHFLRGYDRVVAWVVDSFRDDSIPDVARALGHFDHFLVGDAEAADTWRKVTRTPVTWVPFGTDALGADWRRDRRVDLQRIGRQPPSWDDDPANARAADAVGVGYAGSVAFGATHESNNARLDEAMAQARLTLSFANLSAPADYTHPSIEYLTARWLDALAHGAVVAGISPRCESARRLLWSGATLELATTDRDPGLSRIRDALAQWDPSVARTNHVHSLERTDWRWRFREVAETLGLPLPATLTRELDQLRTRSVALRGEGR